MTVVVVESPATPPRPEVTVVPFDRTRDAQALSKIRVLAFADTEINQRIWPAPRPSVEDRIRYDLRAQSRSHVAPNAVNLTALVGGLPVGFAIWIAPRAAPTPEELAADAAREAELEKNKEPIDDEVDRHMDRAFVKRFKKATEIVRKRRFEGRPYWHLDLLCIDPDYQGLGVGSKLLKWGLARADQDEAPLYLEATPAGEPVYLKNRFVFVETISFADNAGVVLSLPGMERPPQPRAPGAPLPAPSEADLARGAE